MPYWVDDDVVNLKMAGRILSKITYYITFGYDVLIMLQDLSIRRCLHLCMVMSTRSRRLSGTL
ncbi:MAG: hypothetical protein K6E46_06950 [Lachnospiraceae bacterium]|nr:hypothetical protein [Lachnospiraceae bacterium]